MKNHINNYEANGIANLYTCVYVRTYVNSYITMHISMHVHFLYVYIQIRNTLDVKGARLIRSSNLSSYMQLNNDIKLKAKYLTI